MNIEHKTDMWRFMDELHRLAEKPIPPQATLFYGSSTFTRWVEIEEEFKAYHAVNFGFGGSTADEALFHYEWLAQKVHPKTMVWYFGDNDPVCGYTVEETVELYKRTFDRFIEDNPEINIIVLATKTDPARDEYAETALEINRRILEYVKKTPRFYYVETADICRNEQGYIIEHFAEDQLHFSAKGYELIAPRIKKILDTLE